MMSFKTVHLPLKQRKKWASLSLKEPYNFMVWLLPIIGILIHFCIQSVVVAITVGSYFVHNPDEVFHSNAQFSNQFVLPFNVLNIGLALSAIIQILVYVLILWRMSRKRPGFVGILPLRKQHYWQAFLMTFLGMGVTYFILLGYQQLIHLIPNIQNFLDQYSQQFEQLADKSFLSLVTTVILIPISEELVFRGIITGYMRRYLKPIPTILWGALIFAIAHMNLIQSSYVFVLGILLTMVYVYTDSLLLTTMMHMLFNLMGQIEMPFYLYVIMLLGTVGLVYMILSHRKDRELRDAYIAEIDPPLAHALHMVPMYQWSTVQSFQPKLGYNTNMSYFYAPIPAYPKQNPSFFSMNFLPQKRQQVSVIPHKPVVDFNRTSMQLVTSMSPMPVQGQPVVPGYTDSWAHMGAPTYMGAPMHMGAPTQSGMQVHHQAPYPTVHQDAGSQNQASFVPTRYDHLTELHHGIEQQGSFVGPQSSTLQGEMPVSVSNYDIPADLSSEIVQPVYVSEHVTPSFVTQSKPEEP